MRILLLKLKTVIGELGMYVMTVKVLTKQT